MSLGFYLAVPWHQVEWSVERRKEWSRMSQSKHVSCFMKICDVCVCVGKCDPCPRHIMFVCRSKTHRCVCNANHSLADTSQQDPPTKIRCLSYQPAIGHCSKPWLWLVAILQDLGIEGTFRLVILIDASEILANKS